MFRYGILLEERPDRGDIKCRIATIDENVLDHEILVVSKRFFEYEPRLGDSVKIGLSENDDVTTVKKAANLEWLRDVSVFDGIVVIYAYICIDEDDMKKTYENQDGRCYYIFENEHTDFFRVAIPKKTVDHALSTRCEYQKKQKHRIYRVGLFRSPMEMSDGKRVKWKHYQDTPLVPIFELYSRESTLPFISTAMVYGVLEAIVVDVNDDGALFWSPKMGCSILSNVTTRKIPKIGEIHRILTQRSLVGYSFNFPCFYELMPETLRTEWKDIVVKVDGRNKRLYIETRGKCRKLKEQNEIAFLIPSLGLVKRGLENYNDLLVSGKDYSCRLEFEQIGPDQPYEPVIRDVLFSDDETILCRIVLISQRVDKCFAFIDLQHTPQSNEIAFVEVPLRVLFCYRERILEGNVILSTIKARVTKRRSYKDTVGRCVDIQNFYDYVYKASEPLRNIAGRGWLRTRATLLSSRFDNDGTIQLKCQETSQILTDVTGLCVRKRLTRYNYLVVNAQCVLSPGYIPVFLVRHVALNFPELERLTNDVLLDIPSVQEVFTNQQRNLSLSMGSSSSSSSSSNQNDDTFPSSVRSSSSNDTVTENDVYRRTQYSSNNDGNYASNGNGEDTRCSSPAMSTKTARSYVTEIACESMYSSDNASVSSQCLNDDIPTILDEEEYARRKNEDLEEEENMGKPSSYYAPPGGSRTSFSGRPNSVPNYNRSRPPPPPHYNSYNSSRPSTSSYNSHRPGKSGRSDRAGVRRHRQGRISPDALIHEIVYNNIRLRPMYEENEEHLISQWLRPMRGNSLCFKQRPTQVFGVELIDRRSSFRANGPSLQKYEWLVRFYARSIEVNVMDKMVVIPIGGQYTTLPPDFELGKVYQACHICSPTDNVVRLAGFGKNSEMPDFYEVDSNAPKIPLTSSVIRDDNDRQWLRLKVTCHRPSVSRSTCDRFELWSSSEVGGLIIADHDELVLDRMEPELYESYDIRCVIEPVAGGPYSLSGLLEDHAFFANQDCLVLWTVVTTFKDSNDHCKPICVKQIPHFTMTSIPRPSKADELGWENPERTSQSTCCVVEFAAAITEKRIDRLRAIDDPRVRNTDDDDLRPELAGRKINELSRKNILIDRLTEVKDSLSLFHRNNLLKRITLFEMEDRIRLYSNMTDGDSCLQSKKRTRPIKEGTEYLISLLKIEDTLAVMHATPEFNQLLRNVAECISMNRTYVDKTESTKKIIDYLFDKKLCQRM